MCIRDRHEKDIAEHKDRFEEVDKKLNALVEKMASVSVVGSSGSGGSAGAGGASTASSGGQESVDNKLVFCGGFPQLTARAAIETRAREMLAECGGPEAS
eukprot:4862353-Prorocentrum_lima.AAC.1